MRLRSLKGKVFLPTGGILTFGDSFAYDTKTSRLYKKVGDETIPQADHSYTPSLPTFVEEVYEPDARFEPHPAVEAFRVARKRRALAGYELAQADRETVETEEELRQIEPVSQIEERTYAAIISARVSGLGETP